MSCFRFCAILIAFIALPFVAGAQQIERQWGEIELGEPVTPRQICRTFNLPDIYNTVRMHEVSSITLRQEIHPIEFFSEPWQEMTVDFQNLDKRLIALYFSKSDHEDTPLLLRYDALKQQLDRMYYPGKESYSENGTQIATIWEDPQTALRLILTRNPQDNLFTLMLSVSDKVPSEDFTRLPNRAQK